MYIYDPKYSSMNSILEDNKNTLYLGDCMAAFDRQLLDKNNVKTVLTVATGLMVTYPDGLINHKVYEIQDIDSAKISNIFNDTFHQIQQGLQIGSVLVHCAAGISRSASVIIAYLMRLNHMRFYEALDFVMLKRSVIKPNYGFQRQLKEFEHTLQHKQSKQQHQNENSQYQIQPVKSVLHQRKTDVITKPENNAQQIQQTNPKAPKQTIGRLLQQQQLVKQTQKH